jgi:hypothetical protein
MWLNIFGVKPESSSPPAAARQTVITLKYPIVVGRGVWVQIISPEYELFVLSSAVRDMPVYHTPQLPKIHRVAHRFSHVATIP